MPPLVKEDWFDVHAELVHAVEHGSDLSSFIDSRITGDVIAAYDRNSLDDKWRPVFIKKVASDLWILCTEVGEVCDEPDHGCPRTGFTTSTFLNDVDAGYYGVHLEVIEVGSDDASEPDDGQVELLDDLIRAKHVSTGEVGTVRTREGSKDTTIPAHKVLFILDAGRGEHLLIKRDEVQEQLEVLNEEDDKVPKVQRASRLLKGSKATIIEGTLVGALGINFHSGIPQDHAEVELFHGVILKDRKMMMGAKVFARVACSPQRPKNEFYLAAIVRARKVNQYYLNAIIYCAEDKSTVQVGLAHLEHLKGDDISIGPIVAALPHHRVRDFKSAGQASGRAEKDHVACREPPFYSECFIISYVGQILICGQLFQGIVTRPPWPAAPVAAAAVTPVRHCPVRIFTVHGKDGSVSRGVLVGTGWWSCRGRMRN